MLDFLYDIFPSLNEGDKIVVRKEISKLKPSVPLKVKKKVSFESSPLLQKYENDHEKRSSGITRVKILMRKEAADELISKCKDGGKLDFTDVSQYLKEIPAGNAVCRLRALNNKDE